MDINLTLSSEFSLKPWQVENTVQLIDDGNTIPFIARYRKEATGSLDDQLLRDLADRIDYLRSLEEQKEKVRTAITEQEKMTEELDKAIEAAKTLTEIEDIYRPFRPKRKTRASVAKDKGLEPLALKIYEQLAEVNPYALAEQFLNEEIATAEDAVQGAKDIIAEVISDDAVGRKQLRYVCRSHGNISVSSSEEDMGVYENYKDYTEPVSKIANHRVLAINSGLPGKIPGAAGVLRKNSAAGGCSLYGRGGL